MNLKHKLIVALSAVTLVTGIGVTSNTIQVQAKTRKEIENNVISPKFRMLMIIVISILAMFYIGFSVNSSTVNAASYGRESKITVPAAYHGTWYSYDNAVSPQKVRFTRHSMNGKIIYCQNKKVAVKLFAQTMTGSKKTQRRISKATKNWYAGSFSRVHGKTYLEVDPWITFESWHLYRPETVTINGKKVKILAYTSRYDGGNLYKSKKLARQMKNHKFAGIKYN